MKACVTTGEKRRMECTEVPLPSLEPGMLLLKTIYASICGSDLEHLDGSFALMAHGDMRPGALIGHRVAAELGWEKPSDMPPRGIRQGIILGHEFVAEVAEVGEGVTGWAAGDRVVPLAGLPADDQAALQRAVQRYRQGGGYGSYRCMAEYFVTSPVAVQKVPDHVSNEEAIFSEPLSTGYGSVAASELKPGQSAVVIGVGRIGLLAMMSAKVVGGAPVIAVDIVQSRLDKALEMGADAAFNAKEVDVVSEVVKLTGDGPHAIIICVRDGKVFNQAVEMSRRGSTIIVAGFVPPTEVNPMLWTSKQLRIAGVIGGLVGQTRNMMLTSLYMIAHKQIDARPLISEIIPLEDIQRGIDSMYSGENIAVLLKP